MPHYRVHKALGGFWEITRIDQPCHIGRVKYRKEALAIARLLAGRAGIVTIGAKQ